MKIIRHLFIFLISICFSMVSVPALAAEDNLVARHFTEQGERSFKKGDYGRAVHHLSKALLADPTNEQALFYLKKMGMDGGVYGTTKHPTTRIAVLTQENHIQSNKIADLENTKKKLDSANTRLQQEFEAVCLALEGKDQQIGHLNIQLKGTRDDLTKAVHSAESEINQLKGNSKDQERQIALFRRTLKKQLNVLDKKDREIIIREDEVNSVEKRSQALKEYVLRDIAKYEDQLADQASENTNKVTYLKKKLYGSKLEKERGSRLTKEKLADLKKTVKTKDKEIVDLKDELLVNKLELAKIETALESFRPKDYMKIDGEETYRSSDTASTSNEEILRKKDKYISELKEKLAKALKQINNVESSAKKDVGLQVAVLKEQVQGIQAQLQRKDDFLQEKTKDIQLLKERLSDAQERLGLVEDIVDEKDEQIGELRNELIEIRDQCIQ